MPQVQGIKAAAVVVYRKALITQVEDPVQTGDAVSSAFLQGKQHSKKSILIGFNQRFDLMKVTSIYAKHFSKSFDRSAPHKSRLLRWGRGELY